MKETKTYEEWVSGLTKEEREVAYMTGGGNNEIALMFAYHKMLKEQDNERRPVEKATTVWNVMNIALWLA